MVERYTKRLNTLLEASEDKEITREKLIKEALTLWKKYGIEYRTLIDEYENNLRIKRAFNSDPRMKKEYNGKKLKIKRISQLFLNDFPGEIELLKFNRESDAEKYLSLLDVNRIKVIILDIHRFAEEPIVEELRSNYQNFKRQVRQLDDKKNYSASMSPEACKGGRHFHYTKLSYGGDANSL